MNLDRANSSRPRERATPRPKLDGRIIAMIFIGALPIALLILVATETIGFYVSVPVYAATNNRIVAEMQSRIRTGMTRDALYGWLRGHNLTATNQAYAVWQRNMNGEPVRIDDGAWPQPNSPLTTPFVRPRNIQNPEVKVKLDAGWTGSCGAAIFEEISFNSRDRVANVTYNQPEWTCV
jgi:hypothetical protein